jgi:Response regulator containing CheY-like receiver domain and AraC-type DNA-binding domain
MAFVKMQESFKKAEKGAIVVNKTENFDVTLSKDCARAYAASMQLGTVVSLSDGSLIAAYGDCNCENCEICTLAGKEKTMCVHAQIYGMNAAERFGGKYIYFCPMGLTCFASPIVGNDGAEAKITVGPFLMIDRQDYLHDDLQPRLRADCDSEKLERALSRLPVIPPERVESMSSLMFMAVGFLNNVWSSNHMLELQETYSIQKQVSSYVSALKGEKEPPPYPFEAEDELLDNIAHLDREAANKNLNEIFGYIFFSMGNDFLRAKSRIYELLVLISRTAVKNGGDAQTMLMLTHDYLQIIPRISSMEELCTWLAKAMNRFMDYLFEYADVKHANVIHRATQYIRTHYAEKITLDSAAKAVYLSPSYFSRVFRQETGKTFNSYLNTVRIEQSKKLLMDPSVRLIDISLMVGFDNQSYFTKVFKKTTGLSPLQYREKKCKGYRPKK